MIQAVLLNSFRDLNTVMQEILLMRYCYKLDDRTITALYPNLNPTQALVKAKIQLQHSILHWMSHTLRISIASKNKQVMKIVEVWLSKNLIYVEPQILESE